MIRIDVLPNQRHLAHACFSEVAYLVENLFDGARDLRAARVGHHAERAELVAAFLHGDERRHTARARCGLPGCGQEIELVFEGKFGLDDSGFLAVLAREQIWEPVVALRADD